MVDMKKYMNISEIATWLHSYQSNTPMTKKHPLYEEIVFKNRLRSKKQKRDGSFSGDTT
jgi:hypothetical protein